MTEVEVGTEFGLTGARIGAEAGLIEVEVGSGAGLTEGKVGAGARVPEVMVGAGLTGAKFGAAAMLYLQDVETGLPEANPGGEAMPGCTTDDGVALTAFKSRGSGVLEPDESIKDSLLKDVASLVCSDGNGGGREDWIQPRDS